MVETKKKRRTDKGQSSQSTEEASPDSAPLRRQRNAPQGNPPPPPPNPLGLVNPAHVARLAKLCERDILPTRYYCMDTLNSLGLRVDVLRMFRRAGMGDSINHREDTFRSLTIEFLSTVDVSVTDGLHVIAGRISFRVLGEDRELDLTQFNEIFGMPPAKILRFRTIPSNWNPNELWATITGSPEYTPGTSKGTHIRNPNIRYAQRVLACGFFGRDDSINVPRKAELWVLSDMLDGNRNIDIGAFLANHFRKVGTTNLRSRIAIGGLITPIALHFGFNPDEHLDDRVSGSKFLDLSALESMRMVLPSSGRFKWIYPNEKTLDLPCVERTSLENPVNLLYQPTPRTGGASTSRVSRPPPPPQSTFDYALLYSSVESIRQEQASLRASHNAVRASQDELRGMFVDQNAYLHSMGDVILAMRDWHVSHGHFPPPPPPPSG